MSLAQIESLYNAAITALDDGDYDTAIQKAEAAKLRLATMPNLSRNLAGGGSQSMQWAGAASIDSFIAGCRKAKAAALAAARGPFQTTKIRYQRPDSEE